MHKTLAAITLVSMVGAFAPGSTQAFYTDTETSQAITISTGTLDIASSETAASGELTPGIGTFAVETAMSNAGTLPFQYLPTMVRGACSDAFYNELDIKIEHGSNTLYDGALSGAGVLSPRIDTGEWRFTLSLGADSGVSAGELCGLTIRFNAWQQLFASYSSGGFTDTTDVAVTLTANIPTTVKPVVLNEILPNPTGNDQDYTEFIELYNNTDQPIPLAGWRITEESGGMGEEQSYSISTTNKEISLTPNSTTIQPHSWLVIRFKNAKLNNDTDMVRLYAPNNPIPVDSYEYGSKQNACKNDPTPGSGNEDTRDNCKKNSVPEDKSFARIPDGIGEWIDPVPTPGEANILEETPEANDVIEDPLDLSKSVVPTPEPVAPRSGSGSEENEQTDGMDPASEDAAQAEDPGQVTNEPETPTNPLPPTEDTEQVETPIIEVNDPEPETLETAEPPSTETTPETKPEEPDSPPAEQEPENPPEPQTNVEPPATE